MLTIEKASAMKRFALFLMACCCATLLHAQEVGAGEELRVATREGVNVPIYTLWREDAQVTVVLFSGGGGGYGQIGADGWPTSGNFLIRTGKHWATYPFNLVMIGRPSDGIDLALGGIRTSDRHAADNIAIFKVIKQKSPLPLWVVGTSMGTISAAATAIRDSENLVAGVVLTSSITSYRMDGAVPKQELEKIRVPTLVFHHENDACKFCQAYEVKNITRQLSHAPIKNTMIVSGGSGAVGSPCEAFHYHGYIGMENEAVDRIAAWILKPSE
ncbi:MAG: alpha/beta hydrolase [Betaproteobacteria bacterium]